MTVEDYTRGTGFRQAEWDDLLLDIHLPVPTERQALTRFWLFVQTYRWARGDSVQGAAPTDPGMIKKLTGMTPFHIRDNALKTNTLFQLNFHVIPIIAAALAERDQLPEPRSAAMAGELELIAVGLAKVFTRRAWWDLNVNHAVGIMVSATKGMITTQAAKQAFRQCVQDRALKPLE